MSRSPGTPEPDKLERLERWAGVSAGDPVDVLDERVRDASFRFVAHVTNRITSESWVEVVGGRGAERRHRAFRPDQLYPAGSLRRGVATGPSLLDAPRLGI